VTLQTPVATVLAVLLAFMLAAIAVRTVRAVVRRLLKAMEVVGAENRAAMDARADQLTRAMTLLAYGVAAAASISVAF